MSDHIYTFLNAILAASTAGLVAILNAEHIDSWAKLTSIPVLGIVIMALLWLNWKMLTKTMDTHQRVMDSVSASQKTVGEAITTKIEQVRADHRELLESQAQRQTEMMREILDRK